MLKRSHINTLKEIASTHGFTIRGNACFRVIGDGVFQVLKFELDHATKQPELCLGLHSMYSILQPQWFTPLYCNAYELVALYVNKRTANSIHSGDLSPEEQLAILENIALPRLDNTLTQAQLLDEICHLELAYSGHLCWANMDKFAIYLAIGEYENAEKIIATLLKLHDEARRSNELWSLELGLKYERKQFEIEEEILFNKLLALAHEQNRDNIAEFLNDNLQANSVHGKFCMK